MSKGVQIAIAVVSVFAGIAWFTATQSAGEGTFRYYATVGDFLSQGAEHETQSRRGSRVHGFVLEGSIAKDLASGHVDFVLRGPAASGTLPVRYSGIDVPDLFADGAEVVVEGRMGEGLFLADRLMAKCPSKYEAQEPGAEA